MMGWTDRHARYFLRLITRHTLLYTEMVNTGAMLHNRQKIGDQKRHLAYHDSEHPIALQLGGSDPQALAECAAMTEDAGFDEVNLNVGCPSDRVKSGNFGACLMASPELVADCVSAMKARVAIPVTVKCRIGIDEMEGYQPLAKLSWHHHGRHGVVRKESAPAATAVSTMSAAAAEVRLAEARTDLGDEAGALRAAREHSLC